MVLTSYHCVIFHLKCHLKVEQSSNDKMFISLKKIDEAVVDFVPLKINVGHNVCFISFLPKKTVSDMETWLVLEYVQQVHSL